MKELWNCLFSHYGMAYLTGLVIFLFTLFLASKRFIGFAVTLLLLIFALLASLAVANSDSIKNYFKKLDEKSSPATTVNQAAPTTAPEPAKSTESESKTDKILNQLQQVYGDLKNLFEDQKERFQHYMEEPSNHDTSKPTPAQVPAKDGSSNQ